MEDRADPPSRRRLSWVARAVLLFLLVESTVTLYLVLCLCSYMGLWS